MGQSPPRMSWAYSALSDAGSRVKEEEAVHRYMSAILVFVWALLFVTAAAGCSSGVEVVTDDDADATVEEADAPAEADAPGTRANPIPFGTTARFLDWEVGVIEVNKNANAVIAPLNRPGDLEREVSSGSQCVLVTVSAKYVGEESGLFWFDAQLSYLGSGGNTFQRSGSRLASPNPIGSTTETFPGATVLGDEVFVVPLDQIEGGVLILDTSFGDGMERLFFATQ